MTIGTTHALFRTNAKGEAFIGRCIQCGRSNLPMEAAGWPCSNPRKATQEQSLLRAIKGEEEKP